MKKNLKNETAPICARTIICDFLKMKRLLLFGVITFSSSNVFLSYIQPILTQNLIDYGLLRSNYSNILYYSGLILVLVLFMAISEVIQTLNFSKLKNEFCSYLYSKVFEKLEKIKISFIIEKNSNALSNLLAMEINNISMIFDRATLLALNYGIIAIGGVFGLFIINWKLAILVLVFIPVKAIVTFIFSRKLEELNEKILAESEEFYEWWGELLEGIKEVKLWNLIRKKDTLLKLKLKSIFQMRYKNTLLDSYNLIFDDLLECIIRVLIYGIAGFFVCQGKMTVGALLAFITYSEYVVRSVSTILYMQFVWSKLKPSLTQLINFFNNPDEKNEGTLSVKEFTSLEFKNVSFSYDDKPIFNQISLRIVAGEKIAIIGDNGCGKSTLLNLILRLAIPDEGTILLNDNNINMYEIHEYRNLFSICDQSVYLFKTSLRENLTLGLELSDDYIVNCGKKIDLEFSKELICKQLNNNAKNLSGGERQKIALIRAMCKNAEIFIYDEADANLDKQTAKQFENILTEMDGKTQIIISHRKINFDDMDSVYLISHGNISKLK